MLYEHRRYVTEPGRMPELHARFEEATLRLFDRHDIGVVGFWQPADEAKANELHYLVRWRSVAEREQAWQAFAADPEWHQVRDRFDTAGELVTTRESEIWRPTAYSPTP